MANDYTIQDDEQHMMQAQIEQEHQEYDLFMYEQNLKETEKQNVSSQKAK